jgi:L1 cell adhesion molecule like protein
LVDHCVEEFKQAEDIDITDDPKAMMRLRHECEKSKKVLSAATEAEIHIDSLKDADFDYRLTREKFNEICAPEIDKIIPLIQQALNDAQLKKEDMHSIVLAGGSMRVPICKEILSQFFGKKLDQTLNPDECIAQGASIMAAKKSLNDKHRGGLSEVVIIDAVPMSIGV